ncbi:GGDEF domain-containing protein [Nannocystaceae bacterium ST9]
MTEGTFALARALVDALGGGVCRLQADGIMLEASDHFIALTGGGPIEGRSIHALLPDLPALAELPDHVTRETLALLQVGADGIGRELSAARIGVGEQLFVILSDRSGEASLRRREAKLDRQIADLQAELAAREREPRRSRIRTMSDLAARMDEALMRGRRYKHDVTLLAVRLAADHPDAQLGTPVGECLIGCVRGVDDIGRLADDHWLLVLPHTNLEGGSVVGKRVLERLGALGLGTIAVGSAQVGADEPGSKALERADQACLQALERGGGQLLAVAVV